MIGILAKKHTISRYFLKAHLFWITFSVKGKPFKLICQSLLCQRSLFNIQQQVLFIIQQFDYSFYRMSILQAEVEEQGIINLRMKGTKHKGRIYKGSIQDAQSKCSIGSIPSTFQGIVYRSNAVQAFGSSCQRFESDFKSNISPGMYNLDAKGIDKTSFNRKGGGTLLSKVERKIHQVKQFPGPGRYTSGDTTANSTKDFIEKQKRRKSGNCKTKPKIIERFDNDQNMVPGPGSYDVKLQKSRFGCKSSFNCEVPRNNYSQKSASPGPGQYQFWKKQIKETCKSSPKKGKQTYDYNQVLEKYMMQESIPRSVDYKIPDFQPKYFKIKNSPGFMHNGKDRFGKAFNEYQVDSKHLSDQPGPGTYTMKNNFDIDKQFVATSSFMNSTVRDLFQDKDWKYGPNQKQIYHQGKKDFNINLQRKWI